MSWPRTARQKRFVALANELAGPIRSHVRELIAEGMVETVPGSNPPEWKWIG